MKALGFAQELVPLVLSGKKTATWRLFDTRNPKPGEVVRLEEAGTRHSFAYAKVRQVRTKRLEDVYTLDFIGHETYRDQEEMYVTYRRYYGARVAPNAPVRMISFDLLT